MSKRLQRDPANSYRRSVEAARRFPPGAHCVCGESRPLALIPNSNPTICAACDRKQKGKSAIDKHHVAGKSNSPVTIPTPVNDHRADLSAAQHDWPKETLENPEQNPLLRNAAHIRGFADTTSYLVNSFLLPQAEQSEQLNAQLTKKYGPKWWQDSEPNTPARED
jgi:hypothetical protein